VVSYAQITRLSLDVRNSTVKEVLQQIEQKSEFYFLYNSELIDVQRKVDLSVNNEKIDAILAQLFLGDKVDVLVRDRHIVLTPVSESATQQQRQIRGKVTTPAGETLPGVAVIVKGTTIGVTTDNNGEFSLSLPADGKVLVFSFVGKKKQEVNIDGRNSVNVKLEDENISLDEVVAIGYGTMKKSDLTGSLSSITSKAIQEHPMTDFSQVLQGRSAGVSVINATGSPGQAPRIRIRGANSINGSNDPLYIIDGIPGGSDVNPLDIKSVEILKDASATAIYGSRGANGVILITTIRGDANAPKIVLSSNVGVSTIGKRYSMLKAGEYATLVNQIEGFTAYTPAEIAAFGQSQGTDWQNEVFSNGLTQNHNASISGGSGKVRYLFSGNYVSEVGTLENTNREKSSFRANINTDFSDRLTLSVDLTASMGTRLNPDLGIGGGKLNPILQALMWSPTEKVYNADGTYTNADTYGSLGRNPVMCEKEAYVHNKGAGFGINSNLKYKITNDLNFVTNISVGKSNGYNRSFTSKYFSPSNPSLELNSGDSFGWQLQTLLNYSKKFYENHNVAVTAGFEESAYEGRNMYLAANGVDSPAADISLSTSQRVGQSYGNGGLRSYFGRLNYNYASKYYLTATYRADGSSVFKEENRFSYFPSVGLSWVLSEEAFIKNLDLFDRLKLRGSWGTTGNQSGISGTSKLSNLGTKSYDWGTRTNYPGTEPSTPANTSLRWERTTQKDFGIDATFMKNKLNISIDYFMKETTGVILYKPLPKYDGGYSITQNLGQVDNKGFELTADYQAVSKNGFEWSIGFNLSTVRNNVVNLGVDKRLLMGGYGSGMLSTNAFVLEPGHPLGSFWGVNYLGIWQTSEAAQALLFGNKPGDSKYEDLNGDHVINFSDYQITGDANPDYSFGINNTFNYKNFTFNVLIEGVQGRQVLNTMYAIGVLPVGDARTVTIKDGADAWTASNPNAAFPSLSSVTNVNNLQASRWLEDGSFVKVRNISLAYNFPKSFTKFADVRLSVSGQNLFTFTKYKGYDPEVSSSGTLDTEAGIDFGAYPTPRLITTGIAITF
jgi:TonB-linked SusC/RagA family outer membrane protein